jgi:hypothetical protein
VTGQSACSANSVTVLFVELWEEHRLKVFENTVQKGVSVAECEEMTAGWRKIHNENFIITRFIKNN